MTNVMLDIVVGTGGVGKTTLASALAIKEASKGQRVLLITIDPAKRLMDALGIEKHGKTPTNVDIGTENKGELFAYMPDLRSEWLLFIKDAMPAKDREMVETNPFFSYLVDGLPGSLEIICCHLLFRFINAGQFDRIVLDTPPSSQALTFFDVPQKINQVLLHPLFKKLTGKKGRFILNVTKRFALFGTNIWEKTVENIIGTHFLSMMIQFAFALESLYEPLIERATMMTELLTAKECSFFLVTKLQKRSLDEALMLKHELVDERGLALKRIIINQVLPNDVERLFFEREKVLSKDDASFLDSLLNRRKARFKGEAALATSFKKQIKSSPCLQIEEVPKRMSRKEMLSIIVGQIPESL